MTETGRRIGMTNTVFRNASGLPNEEQMSTARDMAILSAHLIHDYPNTPFETRYFTQGPQVPQHTLLFGYKGTDGIKTGYTRASGFNLAASAHREQHLLAVARRRDREPTRRRHPCSSTSTSRKPPRPSLPKSSAWHRSSERRLAAAGDQEA